jgi:hypothetical protein
MNDNARMAEYVGTSKRDIEEYENLAPYWQTIVKLGIATNEELEDACNLRRWDTETVNEVIKQKTGYNNLEEMWQDYKRK